MAIAPSSNLLNALSQLQGSRPASPPPRPAATAAPPAAFAAELKARVGENGPARVETAAAPVPQAPVAPPLQRGRYLGQHLNIVV